MKESFEDSTLEDYQNWQGAGGHQKDAGPKLATLVTSISPDSHIWWLLQKIMLQS
jgi:hypothetical protein